MPCPFPVRRLAGVLTAGLALAGALASAAAADVVVQPGQNLTSVAAAHGVSVSDLAAVNGLSDPNLVMAGASLRLPARPYRVAAGDTLSSIAAAHGVSVAGLTAANALADPDVVGIGTVLTIPASSGPAGSGPAGSGPAGSGPASSGPAGSGPGATTGTGTGSPGSAPAAPAPAAAGIQATYTVQPGDTLSGIAARYGVSTAAVAAENGIADAGLLTIGRTLRIPARLGVAERIAADPARRALQPAFDRWAATYAVPADLLKAMTWLESGWQQGLTSSAGAVGVGQLLPVTVDFVQALLGEDLNEWDAEDNIRMSARYLRWLLDETGGDVTTSLAGYYQGLASVRARGPYGETVDYVAAVSALRGQF